MKYLVFLLSLLLISCAATRPEIAKPLFFSEIHTKGFVGIPQPQLGQSMMVFSSKIDTKKPALVRIKSFDGKVVGDSKYISAAEFQPGTHELVLTWKELRGEFWYELNTSKSFELDFESNTKYLVDFEQNSYVIYKQINDVKSEIMRIGVGNT
ncbi:hypothetical protein HUZ36_15985 [Pseudoalteromonas sp. McH1-7]|uniref:hypothetical protein n=1 Tax=Pseudoalteromonas TaxID=53246 RepID=UPI0015929DFC|nr:MULTISPECIES: hypothetical protein [Pseudoalteromonas]MDW7551552.1 hypothetical protein [Pseudoalteromonas peptidolytica]NUZ12283.1 hypothetical protein [Pseudoalteromonas sp. McH1-7]